MLCFEFFFYEIENLSQRLRISVWFADLVCGSGV